MLPIANNYLFITYIVTSKPKRISVAAGLVHMFNFSYFLYTSLCMCIHSALFYTYRNQEYHEVWVIKNPAEAGFNHRLKLAL